MARFTIYLGNKAYSSWSLRPWLVLKHTGTSFDEVVIPLDQPDSHARILAHSPSGRVPALRDGDLVIWESLGICEYLAECFPAAGLWPADSRTRAVARAVSSEMHAGFAALRGGMPMKLARPVGPVAVTPEMQADIQRITGLWTECRHRYGAGGDFLFGRFSIADAMFAPVVTRFHTYAVGLEGEGAAYAQAIWNLPAMKEWVAAAQAETFRMKRYDE